MNSYKSITLYLLLFFGLSLFMSILNLYVFNFRYLPIYENYQAYASNLSNIIVYLGVFGALFLVNFNDLLYDLKKFNKYTILKIIIGFILIFFTSILVNKIFPSVSKNQQAVIKMYDYKILIILHAGLLAPIVEEIVYRKSIFEAIKNPAIFVVVSGLIFGFFHCLSGDFQNIIKYAIPGFVFGILYLYDKNTMSNYLIHLLYNIIIILLA